MVDRPVVVPHFGAYLRRRREERGLTPAQVEHLVFHRYHLPLAHTVLWRWEAGQVSSPDPAILWALSRVYRINSDELIGYLAKERAETPIALSEFATPGITDRSSGISDGALAIARKVDALPPELVVHVTGQLSALEETARRFEPRRNTTRSNPAPRKHTRSKGSK